MSHQLLTVVLMKWIHQVDKWKVKTWKVVLIMAVSNFYASKILDR
jgi:hypothetical protein